MVTQKDIEYLAKLSQLEVSCEDMPKVKSEMEHILNFAQVVCDYALEEKSHNVEDSFACRLREDESEPSYSREEMLSNAPLHTEGYIVLRKSE